jgi:acetyl-CoA carboxylase alpha subunit
MAKHYLDFEKPIQELEDKIIKLQSLESDGDDPLELERLINRKDKKIDEIYGNLNRLYFSEFY